MIEDFWIWESNICLYEGINFDKLSSLDISEEGGGPEFRRGMFKFNLKFGNESHRDHQARGFLNSLAHRVILKHDSLSSHNAYLECIQI